MLCEERAKIEQKRLIGSIWCAGGNLRILIDFEPVHCVFLLNRGIIHHSFYGVEDLIRCENDHDQTDFVRVGDKKT